MFCNVAVHKTTVHSPDNDSSLISFLAPSYLMFLALMNLFFPPGTADIIQFEKTHGLCHDCDKIHNKVMNEGTNIKLFD